MTPTPELLLRDAAWLRGLARKLAGPVDHADDLVQDVSLAALQARGSPSIGRPWLAAVAGNLSRLFHRRSQRERQRLLRLAAPAASPSAAELVEQAEVQQRAVTAVLALPALHRDVVLMRFLQGLSLEETARRLQLPLETVRTRQRRALASLREQLLPADERPVVAGLWFTGWMMNTKAVAAVVVAGLCAGAFWVMREPEPPATSPMAVLTPEPATRAQDSPTGGDAAAPAREPAATPERETVAAAAAAPRPAAVAATIVAAVRWTDDDGAAAGVPVMCRSEHGFGPIVASDAVGTSTFGGLEPGTYLVSTADMEAKMVVMAAGVTKTVQLRVPRGFAVQGRVVDPDGAPVPFAELVVTHAPSIPCFTFPAGRADAQGRFRVDGMHGDRMLGAQHAQFGTTDFEVLRPDSGAQELVLTMPRSGVAAVAGRVVDGNGRPIARAFVHLQQGGTMQIGAGARYLMPPPPAITNTDADGRFAVATLRPGKRRLYVYAEGLAPHFSAFELAAGERREVDVRLLPGATLVCTVRGPKGEVVSGSTVIVGLEYPQTSMRMSGAGEVRFTGMPPGPRKVTGWHQTFGRFERDVVIPEHGELALAIELSPGGTVKGRVLDHQNKPLARWSVDLGFARPRATTDDDGRFTLIGAAAAGNSLFVRPSTGTVPIALRVDGIAADAGEVTLVVTADCAPSARVRGQCLAVDGTPLGGVNVGLFQQHTQIEGAGVTAADGWFEIGPLPPGPYRIYPTHRDAWFDGVDIEVKVHEVRELPAFAGRASRRP